MLVARVHHGERLARRVHEEGQAHEQHRQHDAGDGLGEADAERGEEPADDAVAAPHGEQRDAGGGVREHDRQVDDALDEALAGELAAGEEVGERDADGEADDGGDDGRRDRQPQRAAHVVLAQRLAEEAGAGADDHARRRQQDEGEQQGAGHGAQGPEQRRAEADHRRRLLTAASQSRPPGRACGGSRVNRVPVIPEDAHPDPPHARLTSSGAAAALSSVGRREHRLVLLRQDAPPLRPEQIGGELGREPRVRGVRRDRQGVADQAAAEHGPHAREALRLELHLDRPVGRALRRLAEVDGRRQAHVAQAVLAGDALVLEGAVHVARLQQREQLDAGAAQDDVDCRSSSRAISGTWITSTPPTRSTVIGEVNWPMTSVLEEERVLVGALGELQHHQRTVAGGVEARVGEAEAHVRLRDAPVPVRRRSAGRPAGSWARSASTMRLVAKLQYQSA